jgi:coatomer subunit beta
MAMLGGEAMPRILMQVIRFCINSNDKPLKKLCMLYWEVVPKYQEFTSAELLHAGGAGNAPIRKLLPEMILVCNALMNDLNHPNEYVRGSMLRFLCKINDEEILGPLIPSIKACLEHRHSYVRKHAALAIFHAYKLHGDNLLPDAPEIMAQFIQAETDVASRRNAFLMLFNCAEELAFEYLAHNMEQVLSFGDGFSLLVLELTRRVCRKEPHQKSRFVRVLFSMLSSTSPAVSYEAAWTLVSLSSSPTAVRAAAVTYTNLLNGQNDNNIQLIVLERLQSLQDSNYGKIVQELLMDILRALSSPNPDICGKVLQLARKAVTARNVEQVVTTLKREVQKTTSEDVANNTSMASKAPEASALYRTMLVQAIHECAMKFPHVVAENVLQTLMDLLTLESSNSTTVTASALSAASSAVVATGPAGTNTALQVILLVRAIVEQYPALRDTLLPKLLSSLSEIPANPVMCVALWILGEYTGVGTGSGVGATESEQLAETFATIVAQVGEPPFAIQPKKAAAGEEGEATPVVMNEPRMVTKNVILSDGTYATQTIYNSPTPDTLSSNDPLSKLPKLRKMIVQGDTFLSETLVSCLTKLVLRARQNSTACDPVVWKKNTATTVLIACGVGKVAEVSVAAQRAASADCQDRLTLLVRCLLDPKAQSLVQSVLINDGKRRLGEYLALSVSKEKDGKEKKDDGKTLSNLKAQADDLIHFRQLRSMAVQAGTVDLDDGADLARAAGFDDKNKGGLSSKNALFGELNHVYPLSGFADPVYAEALVTVHDYDIVLEILILNRTPHTLSGLTVELNTMGDMKMVERPQAHTIGPLDQLTIRASIKVSSTETGHIFGTIVYTDSASKERKYIHLNDIHMDIMDYIRPASCSDELFRSMWAEFEWENKVAISTSIGNLVEFLNHIVTSTNMQCLTEEYDAKKMKGKTTSAAKSTQGNFLAANLYARRYENE